VPIVTVEVPVTWNCNPEVKLFSESANSISSIKPANSPTAISFPYEPGTAVPFIDRLVTVPFVAITALRVSLLSLKLYDTLTEIDDELEEVTS
jgi:hypothetical protein